MRGIIDQTNGDSEHMDVTLQLERVNVKYSGQAESLQREV